MRCLDSYAASSKQRFKRHLFALALELHLDETLRALLVLDRAGVHALRPHVHQVVVKHLAS